MIMSDIVSREAIGVSYHVILEPRGNCCSCALIMVISMKVKIMHPFTLGFVKKPFFGVA